MAETQIARPEFRGLVIVYWWPGQFQYDVDGDGDDDDNSILFYLRAGTTVTRPIIPPAQEHKENTKTNENTYKRSNKNHT
jgi:hypothetical protein